MNWFQKNKKKLIAGVAIAAVLAFAFWYGGDAPGLKGWKVDKDPAPQEQTQIGETQQPDDPLQVAENTETPDPEKQPAESPKQDEKKPEETPKKEDKKPEEPPKQEIDPATGKDKYLTDPVPEGKPLPVEPEDQEPSEKTFHCTFSISCATILDNMEYCEEEKKQCVPEDGWILKPTTVEFKEGENVYDVLSKICKKKGIQMEASFTPMYNSVYVEGINNLYEFDVGNLSGWMYKVNGWFPNYGASRYVLQDGDVCCWVYTCDLGYDVGGGYAVGGN